MDMNRKSIVIVGPTAVGKTEYAIDIANRYKGEVVSADSMQIYKGFDIGSAKPTKEERNQAKHHLIDMIDPKEDFSVAQYQSLASEVIEQLFEKDLTPVIAGGTGLYVNSLIYDMDFSHTGRHEQIRKKLEREADLLGNDHLHQMLAKQDPEAASRLHPNNLKRVIRALELIETSDGESSLRSFEQSFKPNKLMDPIIIFLTRDREELYERIEKRVDILMDAGLVDEVRKLKESGLSNEHISMKGIGYKEIAGYIDGEYDEERAVYLTKRNSRHYAKRQLTWFKRYPNSHIFNLSEYESKGLTQVDQIDKESAQTNKDSVMVQNGKDSALADICKPIDTFLYPESK